VVCVCNAGAEVCVGTGVFDGAAIAVPVMAAENVPTACVCNWLTSIVAVASGTFPPPQEASKIAVTASRIGTFINSFLSIYTPFQKSRYFTWISDHDNNTNIPQISYG
jgi:hypothetical protein